MPELRGEPRERNWGQQYEIYMKEGFSTANVVQDGENWHLRLSTSNESQKTAIKAWLNEHGLGYYTITNPPYLVAENLSATQYVDACERFGIDIPIDLTDPHNTARPKDEYTEFEGMAPLFDEENAAPPIPKNPPSEKNLAALAAARQRAEEASAADDAEWADDEPTRDNTLSDESANSPSRSSDISTESAGNTAASAAFEEKATTPTNQGTATPGNYHKKLGIKTASQKRSLFFSRETSPSRFTVQFNTPAQAQSFAQRFTGEAEIKTRGETVTFKPKTTEAEVRARTLLGMHINQTLEQRHRETITTIKQEMAQILSGQQPSLARPDQTTLDKRSSHFQIDPASNVVRNSEGHYVITIVPTGETIQNVDALCEKIKTHDKGAKIIVSDKPAQIQVVTKSKDATDTICDALGINSTTNSIFDAQQRGGIAHGTDDAGAHAPHSTSNNDTKPEQQQQKDETRHP